MLFQLVLRVDWVSLGVIVESGSQQRIPAGLAPGLAFGLDGPLGDALEPDLAPILDCFLQPVEFNWKEAAGLRTTTRG